MENVHVFEILIFVFFAFDVSLSFSRLNQGNIFSKRVDIQKRSNGNQRKFDSGGMLNDDAILQPRQKAGNNSNPKVETISSIINETLREAANKTQGNQTIKLPETIMKVKPEIPPDGIISIVNKTLFKVLAKNASRDDPSAGSAKEKDEGSGSGSGFISCEMCPSCVGCVVMPVPAASPMNEEVHVNHFHGKQMRLYAVQFLLLLIVIWPWFFIAIY